MAEAIHTCSAAAAYSISSPPRPNMYISFTLIQF